MPTVTEEPRSTLASSMDQASEPIIAQTAAEYSPRGAFFIAGISVALLFIGWVLFYFLLFIPRGSVG